MAFEFPAVTEFGLERAAAVLTRGFADYYVKIPFTAAGLVQMARTDSIDLTASRVIVCDGAAIGVAMMARRGWTSRLAGMSVVPEARRRGAGRAVMVQLLAEARARGERMMVLEVIEQNEPAVRLYEASGFAKVRRLVGFAGPGAADAAAAPVLTEVDLRAMAEVVTREGLPDLPWQLSGETFAHLTPPCVAYRLGGAWVALANVLGSPVSIRGLVTERGRQGQGRALALLRAVMARHPGKEWRMSALWPEELAEVFLQVGLARTPLSQWQMSRCLEPA
jgi:ribosomal protein S18 acetylase RimI-like enzyme